MPSVKKEFIAEDQRGSHLAVFYAFQGHWHMHNSHVLLLFLFSHFNRKSFSSFLPLVVLLILLMPHRRRRQELRERRKTIEILCFIFVSKKKTCDKNRVSLNYFRKHEMERIFFTFHEGFLFFYHMSAMISTRIFYLFFSTKKEKVKIGKIVSILKSHA